MEFVVVRFVLEVADYVLPVGGEDVFVGSVETLVDLCSSALSHQLGQREKPYICPSTSVELCYGSISLRRELLLSVSK